MAMEGANARFNSMVRYIKFSGADGLVRMMGQLLQQYMPERYFPILNPESASERGAIMRVGPEDIAGEFFYQIKDNTMTNKDIRQQILTNLIGTLAPFQAQAGIPMAPLIKGLLELSPIAGQLNLDEIFSAMPPAPGMMGQENKGLEGMAQGVEGMPGQAAPGTPPMTMAGGNPQIQALSEALGNTGGLF